MARTIPAGEDRGPRDRPLTVYLAEEELEELADLARDLGFKSKSGLVAGIIGELVRDGFSRESFDRIVDRYSG